MKNLWVDLYLSIPRPLVNKRSSSDVSLMSRVRDIQSEDRARRSLYAEREPRSMNDMGRVSLIRAREMRRGDSVGSICSMGSRSSLQR